jgi:ammonia channel protein AmtB
MDQGNTAFVLISAALVLLMTPGLAFFYGGMVKAKSVVSMMMLSFQSRSQTAAAKHSLASMVGLESTRLSLA